MANPLKKGNKFLTNHGMKKWWFIDSEQLAYPFDTKEEATKMAKVEGGDVVSYDEVFKK